RKTHRHRPVNGSSSTVLRGARTRPDGAGRPVHTPALTGQTWATQGECDRSDTAHGQSVGHMLLRLIHEIERLDLVRECEVHLRAAACGPGVMPGLKVSAGANAGAKAHDPKGLWNFRGQLLVPTYGLARETIHKASRTS